MYLRSSLDRRWLIVELVEAHLLSPSLPPSSFPFPSRSTISSPKNSVPSSKIVPNGLGTELSSQPEELLSPEPTLPLLDLSSEEELDRRRDLRKEVLTADLLEEEEEALEEA